MSEPRSPLMATCTACEERMPAALFVHHPCALHGIKARLDGLVGVDGGTMHLDIPVWAKLLDWFKALFTR